VALVAAVLALAGCGEGSSEKAKAPPRLRTPRVGVLAAPTRALTYAVDAIGTVEAYQVVVVPARLGGVVESIGFEEGASVTPKTELAVVDGARRDLLLEQAGKAVVRAEAAVERARAAVGRSVAQEAAARAGLEEAEGMLARREDARARAPGVVSSEEID
jgi:multidrug efflux pump subunit AcrA (membrane-fusion protein)